MMPDRDGMWTYDEVIAAWNMSKAKEKLLREQLEEAEDLISTMSGLVDNYYIEPGHRYIADHEDYLEKWGEVEAWEEDQ